MRIMLQNQLEKNLTHILPLDSLSESVRAFTLDYLIIR